MVYGVMRKSGSVAPNAAGSHPKQMGRHWRHLGFLALLCALFFIPSFGRMPVKREKELRVLLTARDMCEHHRWIAPEFRGELRLKKPPLMYWFVAAAFRAAGTTESIVAGRLPSLCFSLLLALGTYAAGARMVGRRAAVAGAAILVTTQLFALHAQFAETDIPLNAFLLAAAFFLYRLALSPRMSRAAGWIGFGLFTGLGFLTKGVAAVAIPAGTLAVLLLTRTAPRRRLLTPGLLAALLIAAALVLPWYAAILSNAATADKAGAQIQSEMQAIAGQSHRESPLYYFYQLPSGLLPWALLLPTALVAAWKSARLSRRTRFVLVWFLTAFALLTLLPAKQFHYSILMLAPAALLLGRHAIRLRWVKSLRRTAPAAVMVLAILWGVFYGWGYVRVTGGDALRVFCAKCRPALAPGGTVYASGHRSAAAEYYLHRPVLFADSETEAWQTMKPGDALILLKKDKEPDTRPSPDARPVLCENSRGGRFSLFVR
jgi:4-amino-4-deoxy-L-arabinose transferase-like glycosyltransferase